MDSIHNTEKVSQGEPDHLTSADLLDMKQRLDDELQNLLIAHSAARQVSDTSDGVELQQRIEDLQDELLEESHTRSINELLLRRIQMGKTLTDAMFTTDTDAENNLYIRRSLQELELVSQIKRVHKETLELQEQLAKQRLKNLQLKKDNMDMMQKLQNNKDKAQAISAEVARNKDYKRLKIELDGQRASLDIHRNLIQLLITGMCEDWSQNPQFSKIMLECGDTLVL